MSEFLRSLSIRVFQLRGSWISVKSDRNVHLLLSIKILSVGRPTGFLTEHVGFCAQAVHVGSVVEKAAFVSASTFPCQYQYILVPYLFMYNLAAGHCARQQPQFHRDKVSLARKNKNKNNRSTGQK